MGSVIETYCTLLFHLSIQYVEDVDEDDKDHEYGKAGEDGVEQDEGVNTLLIRLPSLMVQQIPKTNIAVVNSKAPTC
jgi:hypothetical protein